MATTLAGGTQSCSCKVLGSIPSACKIEPPGDRGDMGLDLFFPTPTGGGGVLENQTSYLKTPLRAKFQKGGVWGGGFKGGFRCAGISFLGVGHVFLKECFFGVSRVNFFFGRMSRMGKKTIFSGREKRGEAGKHKNHPTPAIATGASEAYSPNGHLGTSGTGKAMDPWHEGWFLYSSPANGRNDVEHTRMRCSS